MRFPEVFTAPPFDRAHPDLTPVRLDTDCRNLDRIGRRHGETPGRWRTGAVGRGVWDAGDKALHADQKAAGGALGEKSACEFIDAARLTTEKHGATAGRMDPGP